MQILNQLKKHYFPKGVRRELTKYNNKLFNRTTEKNLIKSLKKLAIQPGSVICVHSMLSGLGYIAGGPQTVIRAIQNAVPDCTIMMPSFPFDGSALDYLQTNPIYHRDKTPSKSGLLTETLRLYPGAKRSYHPTHPCVALGPKADYLIGGSENSETPFGDDSTYGRFSSLEDGVLLLIHTNNTSFVHRIQEMVNMPNLFLDNFYDAKGYDSKCKLCEYKVKIHTPVIPLYVIMSENGKDVEYIWYPDYVLLFPEYNKNRTLNKIKSESIKNILIERDHYMKTNGIMKYITFKTTEFAAIQVVPWLARLCFDVKDSLHKFSEFYSINNMQKILRAGLLSKN